MKKIISTNNAPQAIGPYNQAIQHNNMLFISGQIPFTPDGKPVEKKIKIQTEQCLTNILSILQEAGLDKNNIVKTTVFLKNMADFPEFNDAYSNFFNGCDYPARSTVEASKLPKDVDIEIEAIAIG